MTAKSRAPTLFVYALTSLWAPLSAPFQPNHKLPLLNVVPCTPGSASCVKRCADTVPGTGASGVGKEPLPALVMIDSSKTRVSNEGSRPNEVPRKLTVKVTPTPEVAVIEASPSTWAAPGLSDGLTNW